MEKISVVIPLYNGWHLLKRNIDSLIKYDFENIAEIIVVDDCSPTPNPHIFDNSLVTQITNSRNLGYTGTVNNGLKKAKSKIILLLDSDAFLVSPIISKLNEVYLRDPIVGCVGFDAIAESGKATGSYQYMSSAWKLVVGQALQAKIDRVIPKNKKYILPLSCCVSFRKECLQELNYFDDQTFPVLEADTDLGMRIHKSKWKLLYDSRVSVVHEGGNSYKVDSKRVRMYHHASWKLFDETSYAN